MVQWVKEKLKTVNSVVDVGIVVSLISALLIFACCTYKFAALTVVGVPANVALSFMSFDTKDIVATACVSMFVGLVLLMFYYLVYQGGKIKKVVKCGGLFAAIMLVCWFLNFGFEEIMAVEFALMLFLYVSTILLEVRTKNLTDGFMKKIFKGTSEETKGVAFFSEVVLTMMTIVLIAGLFAQSVAIFPMSRLLANDKYVLASNDEYYLVAEYTQEENKLKIHSEKTQIIAKENAVLTETTRIPFVVKNK